ncbi:hypothetical protein [Mesorhizobium sp. INR15]|uniref:hypothetical protein n=1 Tax=Mesorhizobium sp. INR15 TaxID=2654248 RepID=UPI0021565C18|nr:hypothetical protein [Mesorhizobium sp. INR15]
MSRPWMAVRDCLTEMLHDPASMADHMTEDAADASRFPLTLVVWGMLAMALDIGTARLTDGAVSSRSD